MTILYSIHRGAGLPDQYRAGRDVALVVILRGFSEAVRDTLPQFERIARVTTTLGLLDVFADINENPVTLTCIPTTSTCISGRLQLINVAFAAAADRHQLVGGCNDLSHPAELVLAFRPSASIYAEPVAYGSGELAALLLDVFGSAAGV